MIDYFENDFNFILATDSYKVSHHIMMPNGLEYLESYGEARGGDFPYTAVVGLLPFLRMIQGVQITEEKIQEAKYFINKHFGTDKIFQEDVWRLIIDKYDGKLPIKIYAVPEGSVIQQQNIIFKTVPTEEKFADLASYIETYLMRIWYSISVATNSLYASDVARYYFTKTADDDKYEGWKFLLHDFGAGGVTSREQSQIGGAMHLMSFNGSDNIDGIRYLMKHYDNDNWQKRLTGDYDMKTGFGVPASEHLVMTIEGREGEERVYQRLLETFSKNGLENVILSIVSDSFDIYNIVERLYTNENIRKIIMGRKANTIIRPDSGEAFDVIPKLMDILANNFGYYINDKGYKVLNYNLKIIQVDGIDLEKYFGLVQFLCDEKKWSIENFIFGASGGLLMAFNRDTIGFAIECSHARINGKDTDVYKDPIDGGETSKKGKMWLFRNKDWTYQSLTEEEIAEKGLTIEDNIMIPVFENGEILVDYTYEEVRDRMEYEFNMIEESFQENNAEDYVSNLHDQLAKEQQYERMLISMNSEERLIEASAKRQEFYYKEMDKLSTNDLML